MVYYSVSHICNGKISGRGCTIKAIVSVVGKDRTGIIAAIADELAACNINILEISQTIMQGSFVMIMHVDTEGAAVELSALCDRLQATVKDWGVIVHVQHEDLFSKMHRV